MRCTLTAVFIFCITTAFCQNVGIGTSTPSEKLEVTGNVRAGELMLGNHPLYLTSVVGLWKNTYDYTLLTGGSNTYLNAPSSSGFLELLVGNTSKIHIDGVTSRVGIGTIVPSTHLEVAGSGFNSLMKLHPVTYNWKDGMDARKRIGFLAQDVLAIIPEVVYQGDNGNAEKPGANMGNGDAYGMNYSELIPVLVKAIQEQQKEINEMKKELRKLKK